MRIVLNADDFGMSGDTVAATIDCFEQGALTSATIMTNMPAVGAAFEYARAHPQFSFGVHLTFCGDGDGLERSVCDPADVPALVDGEGRFLGTSTVRLKAILGRIPREQIEREAEGQLARMRDAGIPISHIDSHSHLHKIGPFRQALARVLPRFGLRRVRSVQNLYLRRPLFNATYWLGATWDQRVRSMFDTTDRFYMPSSGLDVGWGEPLLDVLAGEGSLEVGVHPGYREGWREREREDLLEFAALATARGHHLTTWNDVFNG
jgi:predicted glycoside hydrolase/deacetylase ChbG (UPF0249 family)